MPLVSSGTGLVSRAGTPPCRSGGDWRVGEVTLLPSPCASRVIFGGLRLSSLRGSPPLYCDSGSSPSPKSCFHPTLPPPSLRPSSVEHVSLGGGNSPSLRSDVSRGGCGRDPSRHGREVRGGSPRRETGVSVRWSNGRAGCTMSGSPKPKERVSQKTKDYTEHE